MTCATCPYYSALPQSLCRRNPPQQIVIQSPKSITVRGQFTPVDPNTDWCGEHPLRKAALPFSTTDGYAKPEQG